MTTIILQLTTHINNLTEKPDLLIGVGLPGIGKTYAIQQICDSSSIEQTFPPTLPITVPPQGGKIDLSKLIRQQLQERLSIRSVQSIGEMLTRNYVKVIVLDNAIQLNKGSLQLLFDLFQQFGISLAFIGLPSLEKRIHRYCPSDPISTIKTVNLPEPTQTDVLNEILPTVKLSHWHYAPEHYDDSQLGKYLWQKTQPSLRRTIQVLSLADAIAETDSVAKIDTSEIDEALTMIRA